MFSKAPLPRAKTQTNNTNNTKTTTTTQIKPTVQKNFLQKGSGTKKEQEEQKQQEKPHGFTSIPSKKYTQIKCADPFSTQKKDMGSGSFIYIYNAGGIPCRVNHGACKLFLQWNKDVVINELAYDPILITCLEGLVEEKHPYNFIAFQAAKEMLEDENSGEQVIPIISKLVWPLRTALSHKSEDVFQKSLEITKCLSNSVGPNLNNSIKQLLVPLVKKINNKKFRDPIYALLYQFEENGGPDVLKVIKSSIPTYTNM